MPWLPEEILTDIARRIGQHGFRDLGGLIASGRHGLNAALNNEVLEHVDIDEFIFVSSLANEGSIYRPFFMKCFTAGNLTAKYVEGLRLAVKFGPSDQSLSLMRSAQDYSVYALFAVSVFSICSGHYEQGMSSMALLSQRVSWLQTVVEIGEAVMAQIADIDPPMNGRFKETYWYPEGDVPNCVYYACNPTDVCFDCVAYWYSGRVKNLC